MGALPIIDQQRFILATRDTGYRSLAAALSELIDNAVQAQANRIDIFIRENEEIDGFPVIGVRDNGTGMKRAVLAESLRFGGTERFNDRTGIGRFGMGLPNSGISQARRVDVYSWQRPGHCLHTFLDVDEIAAGRMDSIPSPVSKALPEWAKRGAAARGTLVLWHRCDRLSYRKAATTAEKITVPLGQAYRWILWSGVEITVNGTPIAPIDPLFLQVPDGQPPAAGYGEPLEFEIKVPGTLRTSIVAVRFAELPVEAWLNLGAGEKRRHKVIGGAGVSILRAGREIDYGWFFMGGKRRENYDDWWRCEVSFDAELDELFGVTHSKQRISPQPLLKSILCPDLEQVARTLNARVREQFLACKQPESSEAVRSAVDRDRFLPPLSRPSTGTEGLAYQISIGKWSEPEFFRISVDAQIVTLTFNEDHPFHKRAYEPLLSNGESLGRFAVEALLLAAARARLEKDSAAADLLTSVDSQWSDALAVFLA